MQQNFEIEFNNTNSNINQIDLLRINNADSESIIENVNLSDNNSTSEEIFNYNSYLDNVTSSSNSISSDNRNIELDYNKNDEEINNLLLSFKDNFSISNIQMDEQLKLINKIYQLRTGDQSNIVPNLNHVLINKLNINKLKSVLGLFCDNCKKNSYFTNVLECNICSNKISPNEIIKKNDYFLSFDLKQLVSLVLENCNLINTRNDDRYESKVYKKYLNLRQNETIITITLNSDGAQPFESTQQEMWPLFLRFNELDCSEELKIFLHSVFYGKKKPEPNFYLKLIVDDLIDLYVNGIYINKLKKKVINFLIK